jgi:hypothetical protein
MVLKMFNFFKPPPFVKSRPESLKDLEQAASNYNHLYMICTGIPIYPGHSDNWGLSQTQGCLLQNDNALFNNTQDI